MGANGADFSVGAGKSGDEGGPDYSLVRTGQMTHQEWAKAYREYKASAAPVERQPSPPVKVNIPVGEGSVSESGIILPKVEQPPVTFTQTSAATSTVNTEAAPASQPKRVKAKPAVDTMPTSNFLSDGLKEIEASNNGKKLVGFHDAHRIAASLAHQIYTAHRDLIASGKLHPNLKDVREHLFGDSNMPASDPRSKGARQYLDLSKQVHARQNSRTQTESLAWDTLQQAGFHISQAYHALRGADPEAANNISVEHPIAGTTESLTLTPGPELLHITSNSTPFRATGKAIKSAIINGRTIPADALSAQLRILRKAAADKVKGLDVPRSGVLDAAKALIQPVKRVRKPLREPSSTENTSEESPKYNELSVETLGNTVDEAGKGKKRARTSSTENTAIRRNNGRSR